MVTISSDIALSPVRREAVASNTVTVISTARNKPVCLLSECNALRSTVEYAVENVRNIAVYQSMFI